MPTYQESTHSDRKFGILAAIAILIIAVIIIFVFQSRDQGVQQVEKSLQDQDMELRREVIQSMSGPPNVPSNVAEEEKDKLLESMGGTGNVESQVTQEGIDKLLESMGGPSE